MNIANWLNEKRVIYDIRRSDEGLQAALILIRDNEGNGRVVAIKFSMPTALCLSAVGAKRGGMGKCRLKLIESNKVRCHRCDLLGHLTNSCMEISSEKKCFRFHQTGHLTVDCTGASKKKTSNRIERATSTGGEETSSSSGEAL